MCQEAAIICDLHATGQQVQKACAKDACGHMRSRLGI
jgi:hypothetical protein